MPPEAPLGMTASIIEGVRRPPVRPRNAASLILLRPGESGLDVLMGRRGAGSRFMPGRYVFPGGAVAPEDRRAWSGETGRPARLGKDRLDLALARAALRETFEETGMILAGPGGADMPAGAGAPVERAYLMQERRPDFSLLTYIGRAITPAASPVRFHARFFLADGRHAVGTLAGNGELEDLGWHPLPAVEDDRLSDVTRFMLEHAVAVWRGDASAIAFYRYVGRKPRVTL